MLPYAFVPAHPAQAKAQSLLKPITHEGNRAAILVTGEEALDARIRMIANARESIIISSYLFQDDESGHLVASALMAAADRGVQVRILMDGFMGKVHLSRSHLSYVLGTHENMQLRYYNPINVLVPMGINSRHHEKFMISDAQIIVFGGRNISNEFFTKPGHPEYNDDLDILVFSQAPDESNPAFIMSKHFESMWSQWGSSALTKIPPKEAFAVLAFERGLQQDYLDLCLKRPELMLPADWIKQTVPIDGLAILTNPAGIGVKEPVLWAALIDLMKQAQERIWLQTPYLILNRSMYNDMSAVIAKPLELSVLINSRASGNNFIASADFLIQKTNIKNLDMNLNEFQGDHSVHTKALLIDENISVFGSFNFDIRSAYINTETMLVVYSDQINQTLKKHMEDMFALSTPLNSALSDDTDNGVVPKPIDFYKDLKIHLLSPLVWLVRFIV
ncbi:MAG: phosphatidylserine/phosphatidylglycerophosphate/cardiolipin synthase family protein [Clostridiales bacterium]|nr:phosphatidylserine/phosphatidylglycerophosphate/cardiolipin synthase family protein [Clostridiales bacterium]